LRGCPRAAVYTDVGIIRNRRSETRTRIGLLSPYFVDFLLSTRAATPTVLRGRPYINSYRANPMTNDSENPYETPSAASASSTPIPQRGVYRYTELPRSCPSCERKFSDTLYHRLYRRRYRLSTIAFFVILAISGFVLMQFVGWLALFAVIPLGSWAMTWPKKVLVRCTSCGWAQKFIVSVRG